MANTRDTLGDQETLDAIVTGTLDELEEDGVINLGIQLTYLKIKKYNFPNLTTIQAACFSGNSFIEEANLPNVTSILYDTFKNTQNLKLVNIPKVSSLGSECFYGSGIEEISIPSVEICANPSIFYQCTKLREIHAVNLIQINNSGFLNGCTSLTIVDFPNLDRTHSSCFLNCLSLETINLPKLNMLRNYSFDNCISLTTVNLPLVKTIETGAFRNCTALETIELPLIDGIPLSLFYGCTSLKHFILSKTTMVPSTNTRDAFTDTPICGLNGAIYVPSDLVATYKSDDTWNKFFIAPISDYPLSDADLYEMLDESYSTITDSWSDIIANTTDYATKYPIGSLKALSFGTYGSFLMQLVAVDADDKADGSGKARMTWISKDLIFKSPIGGNNWNTSQLKTKLTQDVFQQIQDNVKNAIVLVNKTSRISQSTGISEVIDAESIWIPSVREIFGDNGANYEQSGVVYNAIFNDGDSRKKLLNNRYVGWFTRSRNTPQYIRNYIINTSGNSYFEANSSNLGIAIGFCI